MSEKKHTPMTKAQLREAINGLGSLAPDWLVGALEDFIVLQDTYEDLLSMHAEDAYHLDTAQARVKELEAAIIKMIKCKGRYHTEQNTIALARLVGIPLPQTLDKCEHEAQRDELLDAIKKLCKFEPLTQSKWDDARDVIAKIESESQK